MPKGKPNKRYTPEFKIKVVETMHREKLSYRETARQFDICDHDRVAAWDRSVLHRSLKGRGMERFHWIILWKKHKNLDAEQYALKEILIFMGKADLNRQASLASAIMDCRKARMHLSVRRTDAGIS